MAAYIRNTILVLCVALLTWLAAHCVFEENIFQLLPQTGDEAFRVTFLNLKLKDKIFVQAVPTEETETPDAEQLAEALDLFMANLVEATEERQSILYTFSDIDPMMLVDAADYAMAHTPSYIDVTPKQLDSLCSIDHIRQQLLYYQDFLETDLGQNLYDAVSYDPCGIAIGTLGRLLPMGGGGEEASSRFQNNHLYGQDGHTCIGFIAPSFGTDNSREAKRLVRTMDRVRDEIRAQYPGIDILYHGTIVLAGGNSERMTRDICVTVSIALLIIGILLAFCLKRPTYLLLTLGALTFGTLLALAVLYIYQGGVSIMSMGIGAIVLGVAFSYVLHILIHYIYTGSVEQTMKDQTKPVLLGSLTTIGAFAGLLFTQYVHQQMNG